MKAKLWRTSSRWNDLEMVQARAQCQDCFPAFQNSALNQRTHQNTGCQWSLTAPFPVNFVLTEIMSRVNTLPSTRTTQIHSHYYYFLKKIVCSLLLAVYWKAVQTVKWHGKTNTPRAFRSSFALTGALNYCRDFVMELESVKTDQNP